MRQLAAALLIAAPIALIAWILWKGHGPPRQPLTAAGAAAHAGAPAPPGDDAALGALFDALPPKATLSGPPVLYDGEGLFKYIDGAAPIFIRNHFRRLAAAELAIAGGGEATADVYDMAAPENAAAIFAAERSASAKPVPGLGAAAAGQLSLVFQESRFYVKLTAFDPRGEAALPDLARALAGRMR